MTKLLAHQVAQLDTYKVLGKSLHVVIAEVKDTFEDIVNGMVQAMLLQTNNANCTIKLPTPR
jgi:hypothetical protein